jgi:hypothetical protein
VDLPPVVPQPMVLAPRRFLSVTDQIRTRDVVMMPDHGPTHAAEKLLGTIRVDAAPVGIQLRMVDPADRLENHGLKGTKASIANKLSRGTVGATYLLATLASLGIEALRLEDL